MNPPVCAHPRSTHTLAPGHPISHRKDLNLQPSPVSERKTLLLGRRATIAPRWRKLMRRRGLEPLSRRILRSVLSLDDRHLVGGTGFDRRRKRHHVRSVGALLVPEAFGQLLNHSDILPKGEARVELATYRLAIDCSAIEPFAQR